MMRLGRRASLLVAFYLLTSAATAHADCAWVLWTKNCCSSYGDYWARHDAFDTRAQCVSFLDRADVPATAPIAVARRRLSLGSGRAKTQWLFFSASPTPWTRAGRRGSDESGDEHRRCEGADLRSAL